MTGVIFRFLLYFHLFSTIFKAEKLIVHVYYIMMLCMLSDVKLSDVLENQLRFSIWATKIKCGD